MTTTIEVDLYHVLDRVTFGASILDEVWPGWHEVIELDRLEMGNGALCIGAQLIQSSTEHKGAYYFEFERVFSKLADVHFHSSEKYWSSTFMDACGFSICEQGGQEGILEEFEALDNAWTDAVIRRYGRPIENLNDVMSRIYAARRDLAYGGNDQVVKGEVVAHLRDAAAALLKTIGHMQADLDMNRRG